MWFSAFMAITDLGSASGSYGDGRRFDLPSGWEPTTTEVLETALGATLQALRVEQAVERLRDYYDPAGDYSGLLFRAVEPNPGTEIGASDLWAVATLSMPVIARQGRLLLDPGPARSQVCRQLATIDESSALTDLGHAPQGSAQLLSSMWDLHDALRSLLSTDEHTSRHWVFAAKLCARKRPRLFPVRDSVVCTYLGGGVPMSPGNGKPGNFSVDLQVFAYLLTHRAVVHDLERLRAACGEASPAIVSDTDSMRLLDVALWTQGRAPQR